MAAPEPGGPIEAAPAFARHQRRKNAGRKAGEYGADGQDRPHDVAQGGRRSAAILSHGIGHTLWASQTVGNMKAVFSRAILRLVPTSDSVKRCYLVRTS